MRFVVFVVEGLAEVDDPEDEHEEQRENERELDKGDSLFANELSPLKPPKASHGWEERRHNSMITVARNYVWSIWPAGSLNRLGISLLTLTRARRYASGLP